MPLPDPNLPWPIALSAVALIADAEGCRLKAYRCPAGIATIGWGHTGPDVQLGKTEWTQSQADAALLADITEALHLVQAACEAEPPTDNQLGALVSFAFNCRGWRNSTVIRAHNAGDFQAAARAFLLWTKARDPRTGQLVDEPGLIARRHAEAALYLKPDDGAPPHAMPQAVADQPPLLASGALHLGSGLTLAGIGSAFADSQDKLSAVSGVLEQLHNIADGLHLPLPVLFGCAIALAGAALVHYEWQRHRQGRA